MSEKFGKVILVTGASSGFGKQVTDLLLNQGHTVIAGIRGGETRASSVFGSGQRRPHGLDLHLDRAESIDHASKFIQSEFGKLDILINNAGYALMGPVESHTDEELRRQFDVNFFGPLALTRAVLPMLKRSRGKIINISSIAGLFSFPFYGAYAASKHALEAASESLHYELKPFGIQVALVEPGGFNTGFSSKVIFGSGMDSADPANRLNASRVKAFRKALEAKSHAIGGDPAKVARLILRLTERRRIPLRNVIGKEAIPLTWASRFLPDTWRVRLTELAYRKAAFGE